MTCARCGYKPAMGRPRKVDDKQVMLLRSAGMSLRQIAEQLSVSHGAIQLALRRIKIVSPYQPK